MQLKLTWRMAEGKDIDLLVSREQKIAETRDVLLEKGLLCETAEDADYIRSLRTKKQAGIWLTYEEAEIYSGDILVFEEI